MADLEQRTESEGKSSKSIIQRLGFEPLDFIPVYGAINYGIRNIRSGECGKAREIIDLPVLAFYHASSVILTTHVVYSFKNWFEKILM